MENVSESTPITIQFVNYEQIVLDVKTGLLSFQNASEIKHDDVLKYLKLIFENHKVLMQKLFKNFTALNGDFLFDNEYYKPYKNVIDKMLENLKENYGNIKPYSYKEAFELPDENTGNFKAEVFGAINVGEMIKNMGHEMICADGKKLSQKRYDKAGNFVETYELDNVYEVHKVNGEQLGISEPLYAVKCWCTSTDAEHWLWIDGKEEYINNPLNAIASTFRVHKSTIPYIKCLKRQGDILLMELKEDFTPDENDEIVPLTPEQYFGFLEAQA